MQQIIPALRTLVGRPALGVLVALALGISVEAQTDSTGKYQAYPLKHKAAADVEKVVGEMLANQGVDVHVVADPRANQLLVQGPEEAQQIARRLIQSMDAPPPVPTPVAAKPQIKVYRCEVVRLGEMAARLRAQYAGRADVRIAADPSTSQLLVLAPPEVQEAIARQVAEPARVGGPPVSPLSQPASPPALAISAVPTTTATRNERFVGLAHSRVEQVERALCELLGQRLQASPSALPGRTEYLFADAAGERLVISCDRDRNGVAVFGNPSLGDQFERLVRSLDGPQPAAGVRMRVLPIRRADLKQVKTVVEAYRGKGSGAKSPSPGPADHSSHQFPHGGVQQVSYLFQVPPETPPAQPPVPGGPAANQEPARPGEPPVLTRPNEQVEIETLPDLDVIILRGPERDVEEVSRIIQELERLSAETTPAIDIYQLKYVQGAALVTILTQVNAELIGGRPGRVSVTALVKPNALLLIGWGEAVKAIKELIARLDQPVPPETQFRVFPLRHAAAMLTSATIQRMFLSRGGLGGVVMVTPDLRTNSLIVQASPREMAEVEALVQKLDVSETPSVIQARVFKLENSLALDLATTLQRAILAARGGTTAQKSSAIELLDLDAEGKKLIRSGILSDVEITPDPRTNTVIVSAPAESMDLVAALIKQLDSPSAVAQIKVFRIVNGDANAMVLVLRSLFPTQVAGVPGPQLPGAEGESTLVPLRFSVDLRTNSIIATGSPGDLAIVEALLLRLDAEDIQSRENEVYRLKNAPALDVANAINEFLRSRRQVQLAAPGTVSPFEQIESEVVVVPEPVSNALIISATPRFFTDIVQLVEKLDEQPPQVMIQVLIAEVTLSDTNEFGIELGLQDSVLFDRSLLGDILTVSTTTSQPGQPQVVTQQIVSATNTPGFNFNNSAPLGNSGATSALRTADIVGTQGLSSLGVGRMNSELGFGGLVLSASSDAVSALIRALQECRRLEVLSRPQVMTLDNQPAYIQVGKRVPRIVGSAITNQGLINDIQLENVGLILGVTPRISPDGRVVMEVDAEKSELAPIAEGIPISVSNGQEVRSPSINVTMAQTTVSAADGETIVLGGLITKSTQTLSRRVPWLAEIPVLGHLFRYDFRQQGRTELLIVMTPHVVRTAEEAERIKQREAARMHWCLADVNQLQGDTGLYDLKSGVTSPKSTKTVYPQPEPEAIPPGLPVPQPAPAGALPPATTPFPPQPAPPLDSPASSAPQHESLASRLGFRERPVQRQITVDSIPPDALRSAAGPRPITEVNRETLAHPTEPVQGPALSPDAWTVPPGLASPAQYLREPGIGGPTMEPAEATPYYTPYQDPGIDPNQRDGAMPGPSGW